MTLTTVTLIDGRLEVMTTQNDRNNSITYELLDMLRICGWLKRYSFKS